jgi:glycosyltransferase involved in cell wall biosynthesis
VDEVWARSGYIQQMLATKLDKPVLYMPVALAAPKVALLSRSDFLLPERKFLFVFSFDFLSFMDRKNPAGVIEAYRRAFGRGGSTNARPGLVIKAMNGALRPEALAALRALRDEDPDIFLIERTLARPEVAALISLCDAVVSLHRAAGFGLLIAEAMLLGRPVIATDYSATTELLLPSTGFPVDCRTIPVAPDAYPFGEGQVWADPDLDHAAWLLRRLAAEPGRAAAQVAGAHAHLARHYSPRVVAQRQRARLRELDLLH